MTKWPKQRLKHLAQISFSNVDKKSVEDQRTVRLCNYTDVYYRERIDSSVDFMEATATTDQIRRFELKNGDVLITKDSETADDIAVAAYVSDDLPGVLCGYHLALLRPSRVDGRFLYWSMASEPTRRQAEVLASGVTRFGLRADSVGDFELRVPPLDAQRAIADFLDRETARIDDLMSRRRSLVEKLHERFRAYACTTILRGLDPVTSSFADDLPAGWRVSRLRQVTHLQRGHDLPDQHRVEGDVPVVSSGGISGHHDVPAAQSPGVVTGRYGTVGEVFWVDSPFWPLNTTLYVKDFRGNDPRWTYHLLRVLPLDIDAEKSAVTGINRNVVGKLFVALPSLEEQRQLSTLLDAAERRANATRRVLLSQIERLAERRQALITAALTGAVDTNTT